MACCLQVENLTKSFGDLVLFENISFAIEDGRRVALVAKNGTGKTTLLNIIAGREDHDGGEVVPRRDLRIAYLEQSPEYPAEMTVLEACFHSENPALKAIAEYERAIEEPSGEGLQEAMARMDALEAWDYEQRAKRILSRLKIRDFGQRVGTLSGGQLKRVALANALISESDLLILDEPTNHLDTDMTEWLEEYLAASGAGLLMVTHDRYFLDKVCSDILEIEDRQLYHYAGNYSYYLEKKQERESAFAMIDETAQRMANDGSLFQSYLDVQARFDRYSVGNAVLITAQKADATQLSDFKGWKNNGVFIKKGESGIVLLEPGEEYTKEDGTVGVSYNSKKVFDISQTTAKAKDRPAMKRDERLLLKAIIHNAPCPIEISQKLPENINAVYRPDDKKIYVRPGLEAGDIFRGISQELAHAHLDDGAYKRSDHAFTAYCVSYVLCSRYNVPKDMFRFDRLPEGFSTMDARSVRNELSKIRDVANEISSDMAKVLDKSMKPKERRDEAR